MSSTIHTSLGHSQDSRPTAKSPTSLLASLCLGSALDRIVPSFHSSGHRLTCLLPSHPYINSSPWQLKPTRTMVPSSVHWPNRMSKLYFVWPIDRMTQGVPRHMFHSHPQITPLFLPDHLLRGCPDVAVEFTQLLLKGCRDVMALSQQSPVWLKSPSPTPNRSSLDKYSIPYYSRITP